ncbi:sigma-54 interaction domain-containing protein [Aquicella lusitana]|nr:sigma-54 dependent transcriptional regulator [Aquicella lusitana]
MLSSSIATFVCNNIESQHAQKIHELVNAAQKKVISWGKIDTLHDSWSAAIHLLSMPFNKYELKKTLSLFERNFDNTELLNSKVFEKLVGNSDKIRAIKSIIMQVSQSDTTVLILGQSGTGKDIVASCIHQLSDRKSHQFVPINCGAIPGELIESELFGHEKGAFTGAMARRAGRFEMAKGGTLFLDEIGDMPLQMQVKLLRVIQDRKIERVGGNTTIDVDVRLIAATNKNLEQMVTKHKFREDLYYRLNVFPIELPSLSERKDDIPLIIDYHLDKIYERLKHRVLFTDQAISYLCDYQWPGNIRELQNFLERMVILYPDHVIDTNKLCLRCK